MEKNAFDLFCRFEKKHCLGRSMIEMLGVLAIIGVLSIGGLYAYRQAMNRYRTNQMINFINEIYFAVAENCISQENCAFNVGSNGLGTAKNQRFLCSVMGNNFCHRLAGSDSNYQYARLPFLNSKFDGNYTLWTLGVLDAQMPDLYVIRMPCYMATSLVEYSWPYLQSMYLSPVSKTATNGFLSPEDKRLLKEACDNKDWVDFRLRWNIK